MLLSLAFSDVAAYGFGADLSCGTDVISTGPEMFLADRYTTEIIVNEMTMLGGKSTGGSSEVVENERSEASGSRPNKPAAASSGGGTPAKPAPASPSTGSGQGRSFDNFDDDIPLTDYLA